jgi:hypothetical protein
MSLSTQMNESERGIFALNGITGMLIATVLLLSILGGLTILGIGAQNNNATKTYNVDQSLEGLKFNSSSNHQLRTMK